MLQSSAKDLITRGPTSVKRERYVAGAMIGFDRRSLTANVGKIGLCGALLEELEQLEWPAAGHGDGVILLMLSMLVRHAHLDTNRVWARPHRDRRHLVLGASVAAHHAQRKAAREVAVVVVGTYAGVESNGVDRSDLLLPGEQANLIRAVSVTGTPVVVVMVNGGPLLLADDDGDVTGLVHAVVEAWYGGEEAGNGVADVRALWLWL